MDAAASPRRCWCLPLAGQSCGQGRAGAAPLPPPLAPRPAPPRPRSSAGGETTGDRRGNGRGDRQLPLPAQPPPSRGCPDPETWGEGREPSAAPPGSSESSLRWLLWGGMSLWGRGGDTQRQPPTLTPGRGSAAAGTGSLPWVPARSAPAMSDGRVCPKHVIGLGVTRVDTGSLAGVGCSSQPP